MKKPRPSLTLTVDEPAKVRPLHMAGLEAKGDDEGAIEDDADELEGSCDIGETTLCKGSIHINRAGVSFIPKTRTEPDVKGVSDEIEEEEALIHPSKRKVILLDELEPCGLVGRGCSGQVFRARHRATGAVYVIKVVNNVYDKSKRDQMLTEIRTLYSVESPFLVDFFGAFFKDHALSLVLEYCEFGSLDRIIAATGGHGIPEPVVAQMAFQILSGLAHLKKTHHFHRDIKPQNILVQSKGEIKLTDFGIARELGNSFDMANTFVGTFKYMSPERVQNQPYDYKSDIWSLGLVLIECATATFPYHYAHSYIDVVQSIIECAEPELPEKDASGDSFSLEFRQFVSCCLKKDPQNRASVDTLLNSPWLVRHDATDRAKCTARCSRWLEARRNESKGSEESKSAERKRAGSVDDYEDDEFEAEDDVAEAK